jgi:hypothetical protein
VEDLPKLTYQQAYTAQAGCEHAHATTKKALPQRSPDPDQAALIVCQAPMITAYKIFPHVDFHPQTGVSLGPDSDKTDIEILRYDPRFTLCELSPSPDEKNCPVATAVRDNLTPPHRVTVDTHEYLNGRINLDPLKGTMGPFFEKS